MNQHFIIRETCPLCQSSNFQVFYKEAYAFPDLKEFLAEFYNNQGIFEFQYLEDAEYQLCECLDCGFVFQQLVPDEFLGDRIYEHWISSEYAFELEKTKQDMHQFWNFAFDFSRVVYHLHKPPRDISVLDFGMGWGTILQIYKSMGCEVVGCEIADSRIAYAAQNGIKNLKIDEMPSKAFDYIHAYQIFEHIEEPIEVLKLLVEGLKPDGLIRIAVPNGRTVKKDISNLNWKNDGNLKLRLSSAYPLEHINCFTYQTLNLLGEKCGLTPVKLKLPIINQTLHQFFRYNFRDVYWGIKNGYLGRMPDIVFMKSK
jgi:SAM-dependent methyltransferase